MPNLNIATFPHYSLLALYSIKHRHIYFAAGCRVLCSNPGGERPSKPI